MDDFGSFGGLDFGTLSFTSLTGPGLASSNSYFTPVGGLGGDSGWGTPGAGFPLTTFSGPYSPVTPAYTPQPYLNYNDQPAYTSQFDTPAGYLNPNGMISDTVIPMVQPTFWNFTDWAFGGGGN